MVRQIILPIVIALLLSGCIFGQKKPPVRTVVETQTVQVAVPVDRKLPDDLKEQLKTSPPNFVSPSNKDAVVGLTKEGVDDFQNMTFQLQLRVREWETFWQEGNSNTGPHP